MTKEMLEVLQNISNQLHELWMESSGTRQKALTESKAIVDNEILKRIRPENLNG